MKERSFQNYAIISLVAMLNRCLDERIHIDILKSEGSVKTIKSGFIAHYASMYYDELSCSLINIWQNTDIRHYQNLLMTEKAYNIIREVNNDAKYLSRKGKKADTNIHSYALYKKEIKEKYETEADRQSKILYLEHITPNSTILDKIFSLYIRAYETNRQINIEDLEACFNEHRLILMTKSEGAALDKLGSRTGKKLISEKQSVAVSRIVALTSISNALYLKNTDGIYDKYQYNDIFDENINFKGNISSYFSNQHNFKII